MNFLAVWWLKLSTTRDKPSYLLKTLLQEVCFQSQEFDMETLLLGLMPDIPKDLQELWSVFWLRTIFLLSGWSERPSWSVKTMMKPQKDSDKPKFLVLFTSSYQEQKTMREWLSREKQIQPKLTMS